MHQLMIIQIPMIIILVELNSALTNFLQRRVIFQIEALYVYGYRSFIFCVYIIVFATLAIVKPFIVNNK